MKRNELNVGKQGGFSLIEMAIVVVVMLVMLGVALTWVKTMARDSRNAQESDQIAREMSLLSKATKAHLAAEPAGTYPLNTNVNIPIATLITGGFLPTDFGARAGTGTAAITPFAQPYRVVARRIVADEPPTAVISEGSTPAQDKLARVGVENTDPQIFALKQKIAAQTGKDYKAISATIPKASRTATGAGNAFTKDLTAYFTGGFEQASTVALVNFPDLEPDDGSGPPGGMPDAPTYTGCGIMQGQLIGGLTNFYNICSANSGPGGTDSGRRIVGSDHISPCSGHGQITVLPFGGTITAGLNDFGVRHSTNALSCPGNWNSAEDRCWDATGISRGVITMNSVKVAENDCETKYYQVTGPSSSIFRVTSHNVASYNVCCTVTPTPTP